MPFSSKKFRCSMAVVVFLALTLSSLRIYGLFTNERKEALLRADHAAEQSQALRAAAQQINEQADSAERIETTESKATTSLQEKIRLYVEGETSERVYLSRQLTSLIQSAQQDALAAAEREYATNNWLIAKHILYRLWTSITGVTESNEDHISFLRANTEAYPEMKASTLDQRLVAAQACENKAMARRLDCKRSISMNEALTCMVACGRCKAEWSAATMSGSLLLNTSNAPLSDIPDNEASAIAAIAEVNEAEMIYASEHPNLGFSTDIVTVGSMLHENAALATATSTSGYSFTYTSGEPVNEAIRSYTITAVPNQVGRTGRRRFYSDETGDIRYNDDGLADASSPVLGR